MKKLSFFYLFVLFSVNAQVSDFPKLKKSYSGLFSLGSRTTLSSFNAHTQTATLGYGGNFRLQLADRVSTDWFADYLPSADGVTKREDFHQLCRNRFSGEVRCKIKSLTLHTNFPNWLEPSRSNDPKMLDFFNHTRAETIP